MFCCKFVFKLNMMKRKTILLILAISFIALQACKDNSKDVEVSADAEIFKSDTIHLTLKADDKMKFDQTKLFVGENQVVVLTLKHTGKMSIQTMGHDFVLLNQGVSPSRFSRRAAKAEDQDYIPNSDQIIAHTKLIGGGETTEVTFKAPKKGEYDFLCSFPGHQPSMNGKFIVK